MQARPEQRWTGGITFVIFWEQEGAQGPLHLWRHLWSKLQSTLSSRAGWRHLSASWRCEFPSSTSMRSNSAQRVGGWKPWLKGELGVKGGLLGFFVGKKSSVLAYQTPIIISETMLQKPGDIILEFQKTHWLHSTMPKKKNASPPMRVASSVTNWRYHPHNWRRLMFCFKHCWAQPVCFLKLKNNLDYPEIL